jgi:hypothetical protein
LRDQDRGKNLHHLRLYAHADGRPDNPAWIVTHHNSEEDESPKEYEFSDGHALMNHLAEHASIPVKPTREDLQGANLTGRARGEKQ